MPHQLELVYDFADDVTPSEVYDTIAHISTEGTRLTADELTSDEVRESDLIRPTVERTGSVPQATAVELQVGVTETDDGAMQINAGADVDAAGVDPLTEREANIIEKACADALRELGDYEQVASLRHGHKE